MRLGYTLLLHVLLPLLLLRLVWRGLRAPGYLRRWGERFGGGPRPERPAIWLHAVSVGEVQAAEPLISALLEGHPELALYVTTTTPTGSRRLRELFGDAVLHGYAPLDLPWAVGRLLGRLRPRLVIVVETEIWPNWLAGCAGRGVPVLLANARLSERSARRYARVARLTRETLRRFSRIAAHGGEDARRFIALGADPARVAVIGSIKFDFRPPAALEDRAAVVRRQWGVDRPVWVAASTHEGEEALLLEAHRRVLERVPSALLAIVPRHPERFDRVAALIDAAGFDCVRRTTGAPCAADVPVFLGDTMGELPVLLKAADLAFVGGSLVARGGHNVLEPAALGVPVLVGPHTFNFAEIVELLVAAGGARRVDSPTLLAERVSGWLLDATARERVGECGRALVERNRGAQQRLLTLVDEFLAG